MEPATDGKSLEKRLKVAALAWACTLTPPTEYVTPEPPSPDDEEAIKRWQQNKAQSKESQMTKMVSVEG